MLRAGFAGPVLSRRNARQQQIGVGSLSRRRLLHIHLPQPRKTPVPLTLRPSSASNSVRPERPRLRSVLQSTDNWAIVASIWMLRSSAEDVNDVAGVSRNGVFWEWMINRMATSGGRESLASVFVPTGKPVTPKTPDPGMRGDKTARLQWGDEPEFCLPCRSAGSSSANCPLVV